MFADLFRLLTDHRLSVPPEIAAVFRCLATLEGTLAPGFDLVTEARAFALAQATEQVRPDAVRRAVTDELIALLPLLRRVPRRLDRIGAALEDGRLAVRMRLSSDSGAARGPTAVLNEILMTVLAATTGIMAVLMLGLHGGPAVTSEVTLYQFFGYCLLVVSAILALRVLVVIFRTSRR